MKVSIGVTHVTSNFGKLAKSVIEDIDYLIEYTTEDIATEYENVVNGGSRSGKRYGFHTASAPGEPPATLTGELVDSIDFDFSKSDHLGTMTVGEWFSRLLEFGSIKFEARPALRLVVEKIGPQYRKSINKIIRDEAKNNEVKLWR
ncbi:MAG: hypothetical protein ABFD64_02885 [Armatimonadota bacterium]